MNDPPAALWVVLAPALGSLVVWAACLPRLRARRELVPYVRRRAVPWAERELLLAVLALIVLQNFAASAGLELARFLPVGAPEPLRQLLVIVLTKVGDVAAALLVLWLLTRRGASAADLGWNPRTVLPDIRLGLATCLAALLPVLGLHWLLTRFIPSVHPLIEVTLRQPPAERLLTLAVASLLAIVVAPLVEELFYRVVVQGYFEARQRRCRRLRRATGGISAVLPILGSALLFALAHWGHGPDPAPLFCFGLMLGYVYRQTHRLLPCLVAHAAFNALAVIQLWLAVLQAPV
jgi:membrane protease YdiL (CAAX protease family)